MSTRIKQNKSIYKDKIIAFKPKNKRLTNLRFSMQEQYISLFFFIKLVEQKNLVCMLGFIVSCLLF